VTNSFLLVVRAGDRSLHPGWLKGAPRLWDLHISYFGNADAPFGELPPGVTLSREKGPKYIGLSDCLDSHPGFLSGYSHIGFPDDDLACDSAAWNTAFAVLDEIGADLGQPALDHRSFFSYDLMLRRAWLRVREVNFVELMCPIFKADFLQEVRPTWRLNQSSWGLDYLWRELAREQNRLLAIVDACSVLHTRAIGKGAQYSAANMKGGSRYDDHDAILGAYNITDRSRRTLRGIRTDGSPATSSFLLNRTLTLPGLRRRWRSAMNIESVRQRSP
jgi:hypothetical protein